MKHTILFDLDGTLTDPQIGITQSVSYALRSFGIHIDDPNTLTPFIGPPLHDSFRMFYGLSDSEAQQAIAKYREYYSAQGIFENTLYPGIATMLQTLQAKGKTLAVATSKPTVFAKKILRHFEIAQYFTQVTGSELNGSRTRKSEVIRHALKHLPSAEIKYAVMVGDRKHDILGAKAFDMDSIGVLYGFGSLDELTTAGATAIAADISELMQLLLSEEPT